LMTVDTIARIDVCQCISLDPTDRATPDATRRPE